MRLLELLRPYRVVIQRRVTEEEQVSVETFHRTEEQAKECAATFLGVFREHRKRTNEEVVNATRLQLTSLDSSITARGEQMRALDEQIAEKQAQLDRLKGKLDRREQMNGPRVS